MAVHKGLLLLPCLLLAALAHWAAASDDHAQWGETDGPAEAHSPAAPASRAPTGRAPVDPMPGMRRDVEVAPAAYVAQDEFPREPLGFSAARFNPNPGPLVDPTIGPGMSYGPYRGNFEFFDPHDPDAPAPAVSSGEWIRSGCWYADAAVTYVSRSAAVKNDVPLASEFQLEQNQLGVQLDLGYQPGLEFTLGRYLGRDIRNRDHSVEVTFLGLTHWQHAQSIIAQQPGFILLDLDPGADVPVYQLSNSQSLDQTSDFNSYEFNYRVDWRLSRDRMVYSRDNNWIREASPGWVCSFVSGVRSVFVNERLNWFAQNNLGNGHYSVTTHNNLVGPQVGAELFYDYAYWRLGVRTRAGGLVNWSSQSSMVRILDANGAPLSPSRDEFAKAHDMSFVGGVNFLGEYRFRPNFGIRASFDLLWVTDLALAQNQLTFFPSNPTEISTSHHLFFNGFTLGLEWSR